MSFAILAVAAIARWINWFVQLLLIRLYRYPLFVSRCAMVGRGFSIGNQLPRVTGHTRIYIGDNVTIRGNCGIFSGRTFDEPSLLLGDGVVVEERVAFSVNKRIVIGAGTHIESLCYLADNDGHPRDAAARVAGAPPGPEDIAPIVIGTNVRIGAGSSILKGVTVGDGAVIGRKSVVFTDVPAGSIVAGNPARLLLRPRPRA